MSDQSPIIQHRALITLSDGSYYTQRCSTYDIEEWRKVVGDSLEGGLKIVKVSIQRRTITPWEVV